MESTDTVADKIRALLDDDRLDDEAFPESRTELIEEIIEDSGWDPVQDCLISVLKDDSAPYRDWHSAADVIYGAALDGRAIDTDLVIALLYKRLAPDDHSSENNLAWSLVCHLKGVGYLSDYDPMADPAIVRAMKTQAEHAGTGQPATAPQLQSEGSDKPQPEAEGRSR